ncbi:hypothetical protein [Mucilaginibacter sp.]|jgi:hypothetical protein|uniref:hypothetical protein n=1 Tax=Mucilaginibacter sp. TaxID=1882438 RepID=UPI003567A6D9
MKKQILGVLAIVIAVTASAFTTSHNVAHKKKAALYWYKVTYDAMHTGGYIPNEDAFYVQSEKSQVNSPCASGTVKDCLRGFSSELTSFPESSGGTDDIKKPN